MGADNLERAEVNPEPFLAMARGSVLTARQQEKLTYFKWRYVLQVDGFTKEQAKRLTFMRWLYLQGRLVD